jgi:hypothetical protein
MNDVPKIEENKTKPAISKAIENESEIKESTKNVEKPLMRYFDLLEDSSPSYVLGYN